MKEYILFILTYWLFNLSAQAQEKVKQHEVGVVFSNFDEYGITFRTGHEKALWRISVLGISGSSTDYQQPGGNLADVNESNSQINLQIGREYRQTIAERLHLRYGFGVGGRYSNMQVEQKSSGTSNSGNKSTIQSKKIKALFLFGFNYLISERVIFGFETQPTIGYSKHIEKSEDQNGEDNIDRENSSLYYGLNNLAQLSLVFSF